MTAPVSPLPRPASPTPAPAPARQNRMTLASVVRGKQESPIRLLIHGLDGVGKTTFGANAPNAIFLGTEDGNSHLDVARFPTPETYDDVIDALRTLATSDHDFKTLVIDSVDWLEPLIWKKVCEDNKVKSIEEVGGGYGKGYSAALDLWRALISAIEYVQRTKKMYAILIAHSFLKKVANPEGDDFDRYILKMNDKAAGLLREWCWGVYFAKYESFAVKDKAKRVRGVSTGARLLHTKWTATADAKDRYGLPETIPLDWSEFMAAREAGQPEPVEELKAEIARKAALLPEKLREATLASLAKAGDDAANLSKLNDWCNAKVPKE